MPCWYGSLEGPRDVVGRISQRLSPLSRVTVPGIRPKKNKKCLAPPEAPPLQPCEHAGGRRSIATTVDLQKGRAASSRSTSYVLGFNSIFYGLLRCGRFAALDIQTLFTLATLLLPAISAACNRNSCSRPALPVLLISNLLECPPRPWSLALARASVTQACTNELSPGASTSFRDQAGIVYCCGCVGKETTLVQVPVGQQQGHACSTLL